MSRPVRAGLVAALVAFAPGALTGQSLATARAAFTAGRYDEAVSQYRRLAPKDDPRAARGLARALAATGRYDEAIAAARTYTQSHAASAEVWNDLGEVLALRGEVAGAETAFGRAVAGGASDSLVATLNRAILQYDAGDRDAAWRAFDGFISAYNRAARLTSAELAAVARAVSYLGVRDPQLFKDALRAYDQAIAADPDNLDAQVALGHLFLDKYNGTDARAAFDEVLRRNPRHAGALLGLARALHFEGSAEARAAVERSLASNPNLVAARVLLARLHLESEAYAHAAGELERALAVNPVSLEALSMLAAVRELQGDRAAFEDARRRALARNPRYADLYVTLADAAARNRRYRDAVAFATQAVTLDERAWRGHAVLGVNQLRTGAMDAGRRSLETAFAGDPYDVWTKNTLDLLDVLARYAEHGSARFRMVSAPAEADVLALYLPALAEEAYDRLTARYGYRPSVPVRIEVFDRHADFSVRTIGLVGLGALGVSFGPVIAMDSPSALPTGEFSWGSTLWHELAHTFHLGMTAHRVPRWLSEGLAVYEERQARPGWGQGVTPGFLQAFLRGRLVPVSELNRGFTQPEYPEQVLHSYYQASLVCELIAEEHGFAALVALLHGYRDGTPTPELFRATLGMEPEAFDRRFTRYLRERFTVPLAAVASRPIEGGEELARRAQNAPADFPAQLAMGRRLFDEGRFDEAVPFLERAKALFPEYAGDDAPAWYLAQVHRRRGALAQAAWELSALTARNGAFYQALLQLSEVRAALGDTAQAALALERAIYVSPFEMAVHVRLAELSEALGTWDRAVRERRAVLALAPVDLAEAQYRLARAHVGAGDPASARRAVLKALEIAPNFAEAQELLLDVRSSGRRP